jgi:hypothetical protein
MFNARVLYNLVGDTTPQLYKITYQTVDHVGLGQYNEVILLSTILNSDGRVHSCQTYLDEELAECQSDLGF